MMPLIWSAVVARMNITSNEALLDRLEALEYGLCKCSWCGCRLDSECEGCGCGCGLW